MATRTTLVRVVLFNLLAVAIVVGAAELAARAFFPRSMDVLFDDDLVRVRGRPFVQPDETLGFVLTPGYTNERSAIRVNSAGFRGDELPADLADFEVVLALGDSTTFGWRSAQGNDYPAQLQGLLASSPAFRAPLVVNAGVPSYSSSQVLLALRRLLPVLRPRIVIVSILWNDIWYAALPNWYPELLVQQQPSPLVRFLLSHSGLVRALALEPVEGVVLDRHDDRALALYAGNLAAMAAACADAGARLVFLQPPFDPEQLDPDGFELPRLRVRFTPGFLAETYARYVAASRGVARDAGVPFVAHRLAGDASGRSDFFADHLHPNSAGNRVIAEDLAAFFAQAAPEAAGRGESR